jgi:hypothetical protein
MIRSVDNEAAIHEDESGRPYLFQNPKYYRKLISVPAKDSLLEKVSRHSEDKSSLNRYMAKKYVTRLGTVALDPDLCPWTYLLTSLVLPHSIALDHAEWVQEQSDAQGVKGTNYQMLSDMTGIKIETRSDIGKVLRMATRRADYLVSLAVDKIIPNDPS